MPGIAGVIGPAGREPLQAYVAAMLATMRHEPEWVSGMACVPELGVCAGWVNREASRAAATNVERSFDGNALLLCGECFDDDAAQPAASHSLLRRYEASGDGLMAQLNGMFSAVLIDRRRARVLLFNDRYGSERIYHHQRGGLTFFASEAKALLAVVPQLRALDDRGVADFLTYGSTLDGRTLFSGVAKLPGASLWTFTEQGARIGKTRYFDPAQWEQQTPLDEQAFSTALGETLDRVLPRYLSPPGAVGLSITGGLDTRMILACLPPSQMPAVAYTYAGLSGRTLDCRLGAKAAAVLGVGHHTLRIGEDFCAHYGDYVDRTVYVTDGFAGAMGAHEIYLSSLARRLAPIRLTGNFGSEVLRGMSTLKPLGLDPAIMDGALAPLLARAEQEASAPALHPTSRAVFREIPWHLFGTAAAARSVLTLRTPYLDNELVRLAFRAPASLRRSPHPAMRLIAARHPQLAAIPTDRGLSVVGSATASVARRAAAELTFKLDYFHKEGLPDWLSPLDGAVDSLSALGLLGWHKYLPYRRWFRHELAPYLRDVVAGVCARRTPYWNTRRLEAMVTEHVQGRRNRLREIHAVLTLDAVERLLICPAPATHATDHARLNAITP